MAKEQKNQIELVTVELSEDKLNEIKEYNSQLNQIMTQIGQLHIRRNELTSELEKIEAAFGEAESGFTETNSEMRKELNKLERDYPRGQLNLEDGTITYNKAYKEQLEKQAQQQQNPNGIAGGDTVDAPFSKV